MVNIFCSSIYTMPIIEHYCYTMLYIYIYIYLALDTSHKARILVFCVSNAKNLTFHTLDASALNHLKWEQL